MSTRERRGVSAIVVNVVSRPMPGDMNARAIHEVREFGVLECANGGRTSFKTGRTFGGPRGGRLRRARRFPPGDRMPEQ